MADTKHNLQIRTSVKDLASGELKRLGTTGKKAGGSIASGFVKAQLALGGLKIAIRGVANAIRSITTDFGESADAVAKLARQLGVSVERLSELGKVAEFSGSDITAVGNAVRFLQRAMSETVTRGTETYREAFEKLGLTTEDLVQLMQRDGTEAFTIIGERIANLSVQSDRTRVAMALMSRSAAAMFPIFDQGSGALAKMIREVRELGGTLTETQAKIAEAFQDARLRFSIAVDSIKKAIAVELLPGLTEFLNAVAQTLAKHRDTIVSTVKAIAGEVGDALVSAFKFTALSLARLADSIEAMNEKLSSEGFLEAAKGKLFSLADAISRGFGGPGLPEFDQSTKAIGRNETAVRALIGAMIDLRKKAQEAIKGMSGGGDAGNVPAGRGIAGGLPFYDAVEEAMSGLEDVSAMRGEAAAKAFHEAWRAAMERIAASMDSGGEGVALGAFDFVTIGMRKALAKMREDLTPERFGQTVIQSATQAWTGFFDAITFGAQNASDAFRAMATSMLRQLAELAQQKLLLELLSQIPGLAGGAAGGGTSAGAAPSARGGTPAPSGGIS